MFGKKQQIDYKKSIQKFLDVKRDSFNRLRHLRIILDVMDVKESKELFEHHFTHIYHIFFDCFIAIEAVHKLRNHKPNKEELDSVLYIFEKILTLLPEILQKKWQIQSLLLIFRKCLHHMNVIKIRREGMRLFLIWYQILGEELSTIAEIEQIYASLVPGIVASLPNPFLPIQQSQNGSQMMSDSVNQSYHDNNGNAIPSPLHSPDSPNLMMPLSTASVQPCLVEPFVPAYHLESQPHDITCYYLQCFLDYMITQPTKICWRDNKDNKQLKCFEYLWQKFHKTYLLHIFPNLTEVSIYSPPLELPNLRKCIDDNYYFDKKRFPYRDTLLHTQSVVLRWLSKYLKSDTNEPSDRSEALEEQQYYSKLFHASHMNVSDLQDANLNEFREPTAIEYQIINSVFNSSRVYVNLIHSLFKEAFLLPFSHAITIRKVITVYRHWIYGTSTQMPTFIEFPVQSNVNTNNNNNSDVRAGLSNLLRVFVSVASNVFLLEVPPDKPLMLEEQVEMCKRVLNIYRYMVMKIDMDKLAWEQLLEILLQITSLVLTTKVPIRKEDTLGGRLAPALFQTLIVTWIKANLNVYLSNSLWEKFHELVSLLTNWEELIKEWSKTIDTLTRVMARYVYNINLHDLPLERQLDKNKRRFRVRELSQEAKCHTNQTNGIRSGVTESNKDPKAVRRIRSSSGDSPMMIGKSISPQISHQGIARSRSDSYLLSEKTFKRSPDAVVKRNKYNSENKFDSTNKCRSLDYLDYNRNESPIWSEVSVSRSPSPTHSNVIESNSLKDSPMNLEGGLQSNNNHTDCVLIGGTNKGWTAESSFILWRRMLGILGDINQLSNPFIHSQVMECLVKVVEDLIKVKDNLGISVDNQVLSDPSLDPPLDYFSSWLFKATQLPNEYKAGKLLAYKLLCIIAVRRTENLPTKEFLSLFYLTLSQGLISYDMEITSTLIKYCSPKFFSIGLPGSSCLLFDFINAANSIVSSQESKLPRGEALHLLGSLIGFSNVFDNVLVLQSRTPQLSLTLYKDTKDHVLEILLTASKREQTGLGRSIALSSLGLFLYQELNNRTNHPRLREIANVLIAGTRFNNRVLCRVACDMLRLQTDHSTYLLDNHPEIPKKIIEGLCSTLMSHISVVQNQNLFKEYKNTLLTIMFCLAEWCLSVPKIFLERTATTENSSDSMMNAVLRCYSMIANLDNKTKGKSMSAPSSPTEQDIDYTIRSENSPESGVTPNTSPRKRPNNSSNEETNTMYLNTIVEHKEDLDAITIRLAANLIIGHFINFYCHFPQSGLGAAKLSCLINENDDNICLSNTETFDLDVVNAPNVLFFLVNNSSIISFTELPEESPNSKETDSQTDVSKTPVRVIVRNLLGKFSLDCKQLYSSMKCKQNPLNLNKLFSMDSESEKQRHRQQNNRDFDEYDERTQSAPSMMDPLEALIQHLTTTSPECISIRDNNANSLNLMQSEASDMMALLMNQHIQERFYCENQENSSTTTKTLSPKTLESDSPSPSISSQTASRVESAFKHCRQLVDQMGFLFWEKRNRIDLMAKNQNFVREIRNLDYQNCRETHKIAVIYVAKGQEDKESILSNSSGSKAFEEFVAGLGWEVNLEKHLGFKGGLQQNKSTGKTAPYFANSLTEVVFHVSTRISNPDDEQMIHKRMKHLGNDEIHIVWSEHHRDYRRGIIATEFCDALIVIYPLKAYQNLYYIHISRKSEVPFFGPLFNGAVIPKELLAPLVRATAVNASRAKRMHIPYYLNFFEERFRSIESIVKNCKEETTFEDFSSKIYSPKELQESRPISVLSGTAAIDSVSITSVPVTNNIHTEGQQSPTRRTRPTSSVNSEQRNSFKNI
ncbi:ral GTPase-activating protein subunit alpha-1-like isoform X2 [Oppia nitens]|uniref:ral GTPase-activating protein subunit alpha-1-like isoform X2 n=1 Tax=Oppia nitens TaxID=1686743 RepID=UPI0023DCAA76|nr:ral GTPase-activating protein subunit alpha-1-like isoform X2 [Oppia nitens]